MNIVGFNFTKINAERKRAIVGTINISNNISLKDVRETKIGIGGDRAAVNISFHFKSEYTPNMALLSMEGDVLTLMESKKASSMVAAWKKSKKLPPDVAQATMNHILDRCNIQALLLAKDLNLPSPVPLPKVKGAQSNEKPKTVSKKVKKKKK